MLIVGLIYKDIPLDKTYIYQYLEQEFQFQTTFK